MECHVAVLVVLILVLFVFLFKISDSTATACVAAVCAGAAAWIGAGPWKTSAAVVGAAEGPAEETLAAAFNQWLLVSKIKKIICSHLKQRCRITIEAWILNNYTEKMDPRLGPLTGALNKIKALTSVLQKANLEPEKVKSIEGEIELCRRTPPQVAPQTIIESPEKLSYGQYSVIRTPSVERLIEVGGVEAALLCSMRYASILAGSHHWAVPRVVFGAMWDAGVRNEAFASPFNSGLLGRPESRFFSLFEDVDGPFGSQGNIYQHSTEELLKMSGGWEINPPFLAHALSRAAALAARLSAEKDVIFITRLASSASVSPYSAVSTIAKASVVLKKSEHTYQVETDKGTILRTPGFDSHIMYAGPRDHEDALLFLQDILDVWPKTPVENPTTE